MAVWHAEVTRTDLPIARSATADFVDLYRDHYPRLVSALRLAGAPATGAQDLAQEAFARTFRHWRRVRKGANPRGYVNTAAFRLLRRQGGSAELPLLDSDSSSPGPESVVVAQVGVDAALAAMPARRRACASLCLFLGMSTSEAAEALGIAPATVRVQLQRARQDLWAAIGQPDTPEDQGTFVGDGRSGLAQGPRPGHP